MTEEQKAAYVNAMAAGAMIEALGMVAENQQRVLQGKDLAYAEDAFTKLMLDRGLHHNALMGEFSQ